MPEEVKHEEETDLMPSCRIPGLIHRSYPYEFVSHVLVNVVYIACHNSSTITTTAAVVVVLPPH